MVIRRRRPERGDDRGVGCDGVFFGCLRKRLHGRQLMESGPGRLRDIRLDCLSGLLGGARIALGMR